MSFAMSQGLYLDNFDTYFPDDQSCIDFLMQQRWPTGVCCLYCGSVGVYSLKRRQAFECKDCGKQFSVRTGMPFERTKLPLRKWIKALFLLSSRKRGVSSVQLANDLGITQKTAWNMADKIRETMGEDFELFGCTEIDEAYIHPNVYKRSSARRKYGRTGRRAGQVVFGMVERGGKAKLLHVKSSGARVLNPLIDKYIAKGSRIHSDEHGSYRLLHKRGYDHQTTNHSNGEYVVGDNYTQNIENVWSHLKRCIKATYYHISVKHTQGYANEVEFRYNTRKTDNMERMKHYFAINRFLPVVPPVKVPPVCYADEFHGQLRLL